MSVHPIPRLYPPFRAEHIGSLLRPASLYEKRALFEEKKCTSEELNAAEDEAIKVVVKLQQDLGMKTITDGELRR
jgi:methionine synthase II (cobalamin-independent)